MMHSHNSKREGINKICSRNEDIQSGLRASQLLKKVDDYRNKLKKHDLHVDQDSIPKARYFYAPQGSHNVGRQRK